MLSKSPRLKEIQNNMLNDKWDPACERCRVTEACGAQSRRQEENGRYSKDIPEILRKEALGENSFELNFLDLRLGNHCNLQCKMCNPDSSHLWIKDWAKLTPGVSDKDDHAPTPIYKWQMDESFLTTTKKTISTGSLKNIHVAGGEPLYTPSLMKILKFCVTEGVAKNIKLSFNSNLTVLPPPFVKLLPEFKSTSMLASIDGYGAVNSKIRYGSKWESIDRNLRYLDENASQLNITELLLCTTVQRENVLHLKDLFDYLSHDFKTLCPLPKLMHLTLPDYLNIQNFSEKEKEDVDKALQELELSVSKELRENHPMLFQRIAGLRNYLWQQKARPEAQERWLEFNKNWQREKG